MSSWNAEPCAIHPQPCITAKPPYACPLQHHSQSFFLLHNTYTGVNTHTHTHTRTVHASASKKICADIHIQEKGKHEPTHTQINLTQTPITLHLVCDLIQCIDNLPVTGTQPTDHFQGTLLSAAPPPRWLGTQTSIRNTIRNKENKERRDAESPVS